MKKIHFKIPHITDFYISFSHADPSKVEKRYEVHDINVPKQSLQKDDLESSLEMVNSWIGNCDQKASFLLAIQGVFASLMLSNDSITWFKTNIIDPFLLYWKTGDGSFDAESCFIGMAVILSAVLIFVSMMCMVFSLRAKTNYSKEKCGGMVDHSTLFYGDVAKMTYQEFCKTEVNILNELRSQIYVNSQICDKKFKFYRVGLFAFLIGVPLVALALVLILFL